MQDETRPAIKVKNLYKSFKLPHENHSGIKQAIVNIFHSNRGYEQQKILNDISFNINKGEFFGIVGRNGSGKSTLLKLLAGIYAPDKGLLEVNGTLTPFIELGVGFNPELTGRENVFLNGALLGFSHGEMENMYADIVDFAEIGNFMDQKLKNYSSGMQVRLAFSIAIRTTSDILLIDEVLAVGDSNFQRKCYKQFRLLKEQGRTIVFITHDMAAVEKFCDRAMVIKDGNIVGVYAPKQAASIYDAMNASSESAANKDNELDKIKRWGSKTPLIQDVSINGNSDKIVAVDHGSDVRIDISMIDNSSENIVVGLGFYNEQGVMVAGPNSKQVKLTSHKVGFDIRKISLNPGVYTMSVVIFDANAEEELDHIEDAVSIEIMRSAEEERYGIVDLFGKWHNE